MCSCKYYDIMRTSRDKTFIRYQMVNHAKEYGIKPTDRDFNTNVESGLKNGHLAPWKVKCSIYEDPDSLVILDHTL